MQDVYRELIIAAMKYSNGTCCLLVDGNKHAAVLDSYEDGHEMLDLGILPLYDTEEEAIRALLSRFSAPGPAPVVEEGATCVG